MAERAASAGRAEGEGGVPPEQGPPTASDIAAHAEVLVDEITTTYLQRFTCLDKAEAIGGYSGRTDNGMLVFEGGDEGPMGHQRMKNKGGKGMVESMGKNRPARLGYFHGKLLTPVVSTQRLVCDTDNRRLALESSKRHKHVEAPQARRRWMHF